MKKVIVFFIFFNFFSTYSQCPEVEEIILSSQERVNDFVEKYSNCDRIVGTIRIINAVSTVDEDNGGTITEVSDISGLNFLREITGKLIISVNIKDITGFSNLISVGRDIEITNSSTLERISGFNNLQYTKSLTIALNSNLKEVSGFNKLSTCNESLEIGFSDSLEAITGFSKLRSIGGELNISNNLVLSQIPDFESLEIIEDDLNLTSNPDLMEVNGFNKLEFINNDLNIESVRSIQGFENLIKVTRYFNIIKNTVEVIPSFNNLEEVGAGFQIANTGIKEINGFNKLLRVGDIYFLEDWFILNNNPKLNSVTGFGKFIYVDGRVEVKKNIILSDCSWLCNLINNGQITGDLIIQENLGNCLTPEIVIAICDPDFDDDTIADVVDFDDDNDGILDVDEGNGNLDTDKDGFPDSKDLDSDNDNCFDVTEAGFNDENSDGILGDLPDEVDSQGRIINEPTGYTIPWDKDNNSIKDFQEDNTLNPGKNNIKELCPSSDKVDLITLLNGNPDPGGVWSPTLVSGTSIFDPLNDKEGIYTYTHLDPVCGARSAQLLINLPSKNNAGLDGEVTICDKTLTINLFDFINGSPSTGGTWSPELSKGGNIFDPNLDDEGEYIYTVIDRNCGRISSKVTVKKTNKPNSGTSSSLKICEFSNQINLFDLLGGEPDTNGTWSSSNLTIFSSQGNIGYFNPKIHTSGNYIYTVDNGACGKSSSTIEVEVLKDSELDNVTIKINDFSSTNNSIQIFVNSSRKYEYSLDGLNYQRENVFNNLAGGKQIVYVRGVNGCEYYTEEIFIRSYLAFFTPNNDGQNDFWRLENFPNINYTIYIYNRFGKLIKTVPSTTGFWDGTYNGVNMNSSDYWFKVVTEKGEVLHGNFSLLRK